MITVTEKAADFMNKMLINRGKGEGIRVGIKTTGCSGYSYMIEFADIINEDDTIIKSGDLNIIIDGKSEIFLAGTEIDFGKDGLNEGLMFTNPNSKGACGCGESFTV